MTEKYLLDSNVYINFYNRYYQENIFPSFWRGIIPILNQNVVIPKIVIDENYQDIWFANWIDLNYLLPILNQKDYLHEWVDVLSCVGRNSCYKDTALESSRGWAQETIADPWIIAIALKEHLTIVTSEKRNPNLTSINPCKSAKIPDICDELGIRCITMNRFFTEIGLIV
ncbi:hypothetical protein BAU15_02685 [Enterococcus sp. JM4C]|uniref:DUF4411 family protein n=1 Tax=Candidatus Enterococcus huntleyi TaxID=1857217 RepID=UPI001379932A|nr:DUF4411 family protein [Enterococcus sp. JM4C]KAF1299568.1 hypothetical protein BAU15_02685 [Enterococcus sp. JM4C]